MMFQLNILEKTKPLTKAQRVENLLKARGWGGVDNSDLNEITFRYGAVIHRLRKDGHIIETGPTSRSGLVMYYYGGKR